MDSNPTKPTQQLTEAIEKLDSNVEELDDTVEELIKTNSWWMTFFKGIAGALGAAIGATIVIGILIYVLQTLAGVPFVGDFFVSILDQLQQNK